MNRDIAKEERVMKESLNKISSNLGTLEKILEEKVRELEASGNLEDMDPVEKAKRVEAELLRQHAAREGQKAAATVPPEPQPHFKDTKGELDGTVLFYVKQDDGVIRDFLVEMSFKTKTEKEDFGVVIDQLSQNIVDNGSVNFSVFYTGYETKKRTQLTLTGVVGLNSNIIPSDKYMASKNVDFVYDTKKSVVA